MNLPNKITLGRIVLSIILLILLVFPFYQVGISFPTYEISAVSLDLRYIICGVIFVIAASTDFLDGKIARSRNLVTDFGKVMDAIADKVLVNGTLIALACNGYISSIIPVVIVTRDIAVDSIKMIAGNKGGAVAASWTGKIKTACMMIGLILVFFSNLPFELIGKGINVADSLLIIASVLSIISGIQYFNSYKKYFIEDK